MLKKVPGPAWNPNHATHSACMLIRSPLARERRRPTGFLLPSQPGTYRYGAERPLVAARSQHGGYRIRPEGWGPDAPIPERPRLEPAVHGLFSSLAVKTGLLRSDFDG